MPFIERGALRDAECINPNADNLILAGESTFCCRLARSSGQQGCLLIGLNQRPHVDIAELAVKLLRF